MLGRGFHTLIKNVSFFSPTDMESHNPPPSGPDTCSLLRSMWNPPIHSPSGLSVLADTLPRVYPLWGQRPRWHSFPSPIDVGIPQSTLLQDSASLLTHHLVSTPFRAQCPHWHIAQNLAWITICNGSRPLQVDIVFFSFPFRASTQGF